MTINNKKSEGRLVENDDRSYSATSKEDEVGKTNPKRKVATEEEQSKKPIMIRVAPQMIARIDRAAKRLGISRSAFIVSSTAIRLEGME